MSGAGEAPINTDPASPSPLASAEEERARADALQLELRTLIRERAAEKLKLKPNAIAAAETLIDWEEVDVDDQAAVERALGSLRREHAYLFAPAVEDIGAGARDHSTDWERGALGDGELTPQQRMARGYRERLGRWWWR